MGSGHHSTLICGTCNMSTGVAYVKRIEDEVENAKYILSIPYSILLDGLCQKEEENFLWSRLVNTHLKGEKV